MNSLCAFLFLYSDTHLKYIMLVHVLYMTMLPYLKVYFIHSR